MNKYLVTGDWSQSKVAFPTSSPTPTDRSKNKNLCKPDKLLKEQLDLGLCLFVCCLFEFRFYGFRVISSLIS